MRDLARVRRPRVAAKLPPCASSPTLQGSLRCRSDRSPKYSSVVSDATTVPKSRAPRCPLIADEPQAPPTPTAAPASPDAPGSSRLPRRACRSPARTGDASLSGEAGAELHADLLARWNSS